MPNPIVNASENNPWQSFEDSWRFHQFDNFVNGGALYQSLVPGEAQYSEWSQQMTATMYQNWYNSAPEQMRRALEAGINPFTAASGIAGNGAGSVSPAPSAVNNSAAPAMLSAAGSALGSLGSTFGNVAQGISLLQKLRPEINKINAETQSIFESLGFTKLQSKAMSIQLQYLDQKEQIGVWQALATFDKTKQEYHNLVATHQNILAQYDEIIEHKELLIQQQGEVEARKLVNDAMKGKIEEETRFMKADNDFFEQHHYRLGTPIYDSIRDMMVSDGTFNPESFGDVVAGYDGKISGAVEDARQYAIESHAYNIAYESGRAAYDFDWDAPPKTISEFLWKGVGNIKTNLKNSIGRMFKRGSESKEVYEPSKKQLRQEYMSYKQQLDQQYMLLNFRTSDNVDENGHWKSIDEKIEIMKMRAELDKMPKSYNEWLKYVKSH